MYVSPIPFIYAYCKEAAARYASEWPILSEIVWRTHGDVDDPMNELVCRVQMTIARTHNSGPRFAAIQVRARLYMTGPDGDKVSYASDAHGNHGRLHQHGLGPTGHGQEGEVDG